MTTLKIIARIHNDFSSKFGIPRQSNLINELQSTMVFEPDYRNEDALRGLEDFTHIWLIWGFSMVQPREIWQPTVRPPRLGGNTRMGVFATRSPNRPNPIGLSSVQLQSIQRHPTLGPVIHVSGADLMHNTPIYDIKPYLPFVDSHPNASCGFAQEAPAPKLQVLADAVLLNRLPSSKHPALLAVLAHDPRPPYQDDPTRIYGMDFAGFTIHFSVEGMILTVQNITPIEE